MANFKQGDYVPINQDKCLNVSVEGRYPYYRSSWEYKVFRMLDTNINVVKWGSELKKTMIPYKMPSANGKMESHVYYPDIYVEIIDRDTKDVARYLIEVKPKRDGMMPEMPKKQTKKAMSRYNERVSIYLKNEAKWKTAKAWCAHRGIVFKVFTEDTIFNKLKPNKEN